MLSPLSFFWLGPLADDLEDVPAAVVFRKELSIIAALMSGREKFLYIFYINKLKIYFFFYN